MGRDEFMDVVYGELSEDPTNNRANRIIEAADAYAEEEAEKAAESTMSKPDVCKTKHRPPAGTNSVAQVTQEVKEAVFDGYIDHPLVYVTGTGEENSFIVSRNGKEFRITVFEEW